jgi:serine phosphatase RsbU (regulator of sigma subunit)
MDSAGWFYRIKLLAVIVFLFISASVTRTAQEFDNESRSVYILDIARYVQWDNIDDISVFRIGILEPVDDLFPVIKRHALERETIQNRPVEVIHYTEISGIEPVNLLYLNKRYDYDIALVLNRIRGNNTLLISENYEFHRSMINFIVFNGQERFEINEDRMNQEGLYVNELFKEHAVTTEADWQEIYTRIELELEQEKIIVLEQNRLIEEQLKEIDQQQEQITEQQLHIENQKDEIERLGVLLGRLEQEIKNRQRELDIKNRQIALQNEEIREQTEELEKNRLEVERQADILAGQLEQIKQQETRIADQVIILGRQLDQIEKQRMLIWFFLIMLVFAVVLAYFIYNSYRIKREANVKLEEKNILITRQRDEIEKQRDDISEQRDRIAEQNKLIWDSIHYAKRIQSALLPDDLNFNNVLDHFFIMYRPKDVVSGDFYWESKVGDEVIVVAADCTGHGVPGALMSMLGVTFLNEIVNTRNITRPSEILDALRDDVINAFNQKGQRDDEIYDGMDIAVCCINQKNNTVQFSGANNPLVLIRESEVYQFKGDRMPVAISDNMMAFNNHTIELQQNDQIYIFSDGYIDQFGGENNKKFMRKRLVKLLTDIKDEPMNNQKEILVKTFDDWKGANEQTDDVVIIGMRI